MIYSSLAILALSASAMVSPSSNPVRMNSRHTHPDTRVTIVLQNDGISFGDIKIGGQVYTVRSHGSLHIKAPVGTVIYADNRMAHYKRGDTIVELTPGLDNQQVVID